MFHEKKSSFVSFMGNVTCYVIRNYVHQVRDTVKRIIYVYTVYVFV